MGFVSRSTSSPGRTGRCCPTSTRRGTRRTAPTTSASTSPSAACAWCDAPRRSPPGSGGSSWLPPVATIASHPRRPHGSHRTRAGSPTIAARSRSGTTNSPRGLEQGLTISGASRGCRRCGRRPAARAAVRAHRDALAPAQRGRPGDRLRGGRLGAGRSPRAAEGRGREGPRASRAIRGLERGRRARDPDPDRRPRRELPALRRPARDLPVVDRRGEPGPGQLRLRGGDRGRRQRRRLLRRHRRRALLRQRADERGAGLRVPRLGGRACDDGRLVHRIQPGRCEPRVCGGYGRGHGWRRVLRRHRRRPELRQRADGRRPGLRLLRQLGRAEHHGALDRREQPGLELLRLDRRDGRGRPERRLLRHHRRCPLLRQHLRQRGRGVRLLQRRQILPRVPELGGLWRAGVGALRLRGRHGGGRQRRRPLRRRGRGAALRQRRGRRRRCVPVPKRRQQARDQGELDRPVQPGRCAPRRIRGDGRRRQRRRLRRHHRRRDVLRQRPGQRRPGVRLPRRRSRLAGMGVVLRERPGQLRAGPLRGDRRRRERRRLCGRHRERPVLRQRGNRRGPGQRDPRLGGGAGGQRQLDGGVEPGVRALRALGRHGRRCER